MNIKKKKGFTIVELVIVIAVIGILSAILIPTFANLVEKANKTALQENLRNAYVEYAGLAADTEGFLSQEEVAFTEDDGTTYYVYYSGKYYKVEGGEITVGKDTYTVTDGAKSKVTVEVDKTEYSTFGNYTAKQVSVAKKAA